MSACFFKNDCYLDFLKKFKNSKFYIIKYPGNAGDKLIHFATNKILKDLNICLVNDPTEAEVLLWPGGNISMWRVGKETVYYITNLMPTKKVIIGPATIMPSFFKIENYIKKISKRVLAVFSRDPKSFMYLKKALGNTGIKYQLSHDPVFYLSGSDWINQLKKRSGAKYILVAFRNDFEGELFKTDLLRLIASLLPWHVTKKITEIFNSRIVKNRIKKIISQSGSKEKLKICDPTEASMEDFMKIINDASEVHTDRLHVMIVSILLNKKTCIYRTAYDKLETIYEHSVKSNKLIDCSKVTFQSS